MIYFHIPFCKQKCSYCNFHFSTSLKLKDEMLAAMHKELEIRQSEMQSKTISSVYFGGGTPSVLSVDEITKLIDHMNSFFDFENNVEITLEANPDDLNKDFLKKLLQSPVNRLSIGTQSFYEPDLKMMNRAHTASEAEDSIKRAQDFEFHNISIDLIYGSPTSDFEIWKNNLSKAVELQVPHISAYALTIEPKTALERWISLKKIDSPDENLQSEEYLFMMNFLKQNGFDHYEISNFGKPDFYSKHNSAYWKGHEYLGIGPSAHSFDGKSMRSWNVANNVQYVKALNEGNLAMESEKLTEKDQFNEMIMIGLRTRWGVDLTRLKSEFSNEIVESIDKNIDPKLKSGILKIENHHLKIEEEHWFMADGIASDLFLL